MLSSADRAVFTAAFCPVLLVLGLIVPSGLLAEEREQPAVSVPDRQALVALAALAVTHGYPDAAGGELMAGSLTLTRQGRSRERRQEGLHIKLPDGGWLVDLVRYYPAGGDTTVTPAELAPVALADLLGKSADYQREDLDDYLDWLDDMLDGGTARAQAEWQAGQPWLQVANTSENGLWSTDFIALTVHLHRLGHPEAWRMACLLHLRGMGYGGGNDQSVSQPVPISLVDGGHGHFGMDVDMVMVEELTEEAPAEEREERSALIGYLRSGLGDWFRRQLIRSKPLDWLTPEQIKAGTLAFLDPDQPADGYERQVVDRLLARQAMPAALPEDADLLTRAAYWTPARRGGMRGMSWDDIPPEALASLPPEQLAALEEHLGPRGDQSKAAKKPFSPADIDALVAQIGSTGPSRWLDNGHPRTDGDAALRVIARHFGVDPRLLSDRVVSAPWTDAERAATAEAIQAWWAGLTDKSPQAVRLAALPKLSPEAITALLQGLQEQEKTALLDALAAKWAKGMPPILEPYGFAGLLGSIGSHAGIAQAVDSWPVQGPHERLLVAWHLQRGKDEHFIRLFKAWMSGELAKQQSDPQDPSLLEQAAEALGVGELGELAAEMAIAYEDDSEIATDLLSMAAHAPEAGRMAQLLGKLKGPMDAPGVWELGQAVLWYGSYHTAVVQLLQNSPQDHEDNEEETPQAARLAIPLALLVTLLHDERPASPDVLERAQEEFFWDGMDDEEEGAEQPLPKGLRICDLVGANMDSVGWTYYELLESEEGDNPFDEVDDLSLDLRAPKAARDAELKKIRAIFLKALPVALKAAELPALDLGESEAGGDAESLF